MSHDGGLRAGSQHRDKIRSAVRQLWSDALDLDDTWSDDTPFVVLGGYSLLALSLAEKMSSVLDVAIPRTLLLERTSLSAVLDWITDDSGMAQDGPTVRTEPEMGTASALLQTPEAMVTPLSPLQQAYVLGESAGFDLSRAAIFAEDYAVDSLDVELLERAILQLMSRHEVLRSAFMADGSQRPLPTPTTAPLERFDLRELTPQEAIERVEQDFDSFIRDVPGLESGVAIRAVVYRLRRGYRVHVLGRLLAFDGRSGEVFADELATLLSGESLPDVEISFSEYQLLIAETNKSARAEDREFWMHRIDSLPSAPALPLRPRQQVRGHQVKRRTMSIEPHIWTEIRERAAERGLTPTAAVCAAFCEVLRDFADDPAFTLNVMYGARKPVHPGVARIVGNCSDTVLVDCTATARTFEERARRISASIIQSLEHGAYSGVDVIRELSSRKGASRTPAMPVVFASVLGGESARGIFLERLGWKRIRGEVQTPQVTFDHQIFDVRGQLLVNWDTVEELFPDGVVDAMFASYRQILVSLGTDAGAWERTHLTTLPETTLAIRSRVNDAVVPMPMTTLHDLVFDQARRAPDAPAVFAPDGSVTYAQLTSAALAVAEQLRASGVAAGDCVVVSAARGWRGVAGLLGILATGAAYVPLGAGWPDVRVHQVIARAKPKCALDDESIVRWWPSGLKVLPLDTSTSSAENWAAALEELPEVDIDSLAYVIFTSGTTGEPKGVAIAHQSAVNTILDLLDRFSVGTRDTALALSETTFDLSVFDIFGTLAAGARLVVPDAQQVRDIAALHTLCATQNVSIWNSVPAFAVMLADYREAAPRAPLSSLRLIMASGDWVPLSLRERLSRTLPHVELMSLGGATEASIWSCVQPVPFPVPAAWTSVPYGTPLSNQGFRVLDPTFSDRPDWVAGELYITGRGLAKEYLNDPKITSASFFDHPVDDLRLYRTGDRARYWPDGRLEFLGRRDSQVKVNGMRVELTEVESALLQLSDIEHAAAVVESDALGSAIVAHVVTTAGNESTILNSLRERLPDYMVPRTIIVHNEFPLTPNGKIDRNRLLATPQQRERKTVERAEDLEPVDDTEATLLALMREVVPVSGVTDDFFASGGHSLAAAVLLNRVEQTFGTRIPLMTLYEARTARALAVRLRREDPEGDIHHFGGTGDPLVLVHPVGGDVICYQPLMGELSKAFDVFGIASDAASQRERTVEGLAADYHKRIQRHFGTRTVHLAGWSFGAVVAYEIARQADGAHPVVMLDPWVAKQPGAAVSDESLRVAFIRDLARGRSVDIDFTEPAIADIFAVYRANALALSRYRLEPGRQLTAMVVVADQGFGPAQPNYLQPLFEALDGIERKLFSWHTVSGDHFAISDAKRAAEMASLVKIGFLA